MNVQFPRAIREEGAKYIVDSLEPSADGSFYRVKGEIKLLLLPGEQRRSYGYAASGSRKKNLAKSSVSAKTAADLEEVDQVGDGVLVQCVKEGSKLRARVVSYGYDPDKNMRFPRSIRELGILYVVDDVQESGDGKYYITFGKVRRLKQ